MKIVLLSVAAAALASAQPKVPADQQANVNKLSADLSAIKTGSTVTSAMLQQLEADVMAMAKGATKPSQASVDKLVTDLSADLTNHTFSVVNLAKLSADLTAVLNSSSIPPAEVSAAVTNVQSVLTASGVSAADVQLITSDLEAIGTTAQGARGKRFQRK